MEPAATPRRRGATRCGENALLALMLLIAGLLVVTTVPPRARAATLCVGGAGPGNYTTIQEAVDAASPGDTVCVYSGTYVENVVIAKTLTLVGEDRNTTIIDGGRAGTVLNVSADWVNVSGFTVRNGLLAWPDAGIQLFNAGHARIVDNTVVGNGYGIRLESSRDSILAYNAVSGSYQETEVWVGSSANVTLANNTVVTNGTNGVAVYGSTGMVLANNSIEWRAGVMWLGFDADSLRDSSGATFVNNSMVGSGISLYGDLVEYWNTHEIDASNTVNGKPVFYVKDVTGGTVPPGAGQVLLANATGILVTGQVLANTTAGLQLGFSRNNTVAGNMLPENHLNGIVLLHSANNTIANNTVTGSLYVRGVALVDSDGNVVSNNTFADAAGVDLFRSRNNTLTGNHGLPGRTDYWSLLILLESGAEFNLVENNTAQFDRGGGLLVFWAGNNTIRYNKFAVGEGGTAVMLGAAANNLLTDNLISNSGVGIWIYNVVPEPSGVSFNNSIYHNVFANISGVVAFDEGLNNSWDDGYPSGGNHWWNYTGVDNCSGPNQDVCPDPDGIGDTPYDIPYASRDRYPLMGPGPMSRPLAPEGLAAIGDPTRVQLSWSPPASPGGSPISHYRIYRGTSPGAQTFLTETADVTSYEDADVTTGLTYFYRLAAVNAAGEGAVTPEVNATVAALPPSEPRNPAASGGDRQITLTWSPPASDGGSPVTGYRVYRGDFPGGETVLLDIGPVTSYADTGLSNGRPYYYQVAAMNVGGVGPRSAEVNAIPAAIPGPPVGVAAVSGDQTVTLNWSPPIDTGGFPITNYRIYRGAAPGSTTYLATVGNVLAHTDTGLGNGVPYYYEVAAVNGVGEGPRSAEVSATPRTTPTEPRNLAIRVGDGRLGLMWDPPQSDGGSPITTYRIYRGLSPGAETFLAETADVSYDDVGLTNGLTYSYRVAATNAAGEGPSSLSVGATPRAAPTVEAVARASAEVRVGERVTFDGSASTGDITRYEWAIRNERGAIVAVLGGRTADYVFRDAGRYTVTLTVFDEASGLRAADTLTVVVVGAFDWLPILVAVAAFAVALGSRTERARVALLMLVAPAFRRKAEEDPDTRGMIRGYVLVHPGDTYTDIKQNLRLSDGQAAWHLAKLEKEGVLRSRVQGTRRRYYPAKELPPLENGGELHEVQQRLIRIAQEHPGLAVAVLAGELRVSRQLALYHLRALSRMGLLSLERRGVRLRIFPGELDQT